MSKKRYYKCLDSRHTGGYSTFVWPTEEGAVLPPVEGELKMCRNSYHVCDEDQIIGWIRTGENAVVVEVVTGEEILPGNNKNCIRTGTIGKALKWGVYEQLMFEADVAERVLHIYESQYPDDPRIRNMIAAKRAKARGEISEADYKLAAMAAEAAAKAAGGGAAGHAGWAARAAAREAWDVALDAVWAAAEAAERKWQIRQLKYRLGLLKTPAKGGRR